MGIKVVKIMTFANDLLQYFLSILIWVYTKWQWNASCYNSTRKTEYIELVLKFGGLSFELLFSIKNDNFNIVYLNLEGDSRSRMTIQKIIKKL